MRVLALISDGYGAHGGISAYNQELLNALGDCERISRLRVLPRFAQQAPASDRIVQESARENRYHYALAVVARCLREPFDWVFCGHLHHLPLARCAAALCGGRVWLQLHGIESWQRPGWAISAAAQRCDLVTAVSRFTREQFLSWCDIDPQRVKVLSNTFAPHFTPGCADAQLRERLAPNGEAVILTVARVQRAERYKGHEQVMLAMLEAPLRLQPRPVYVIAGHGDDLGSLGRIAHGRIHPKARASQLGSGRSPDPRIGTRDQNTPGLDRHSSSFRHHRSLLVSSAEPRAESPSRFEV